MIMNEVADVRAATEEVGRSKVIFLELFSIFYVQRLSMLNLRNFFMFIFISIYKFLLKCFV